MAKRRDGANENPSDAAAAEAVSNGQRLSVQLDEGGRIAWDRMRPATREQLTKVLSDPAVAQQLGTAAPGAASAPGLESTMLAGVIYNAASSLMVALARRSGYTAEQASVLSFNSAEVEQLAPLTGKVLDKWLPAGKYQDELMLALALTATVGGKISMLRKSATVIQMAPQQNAMEMTPTPAS
jgi:hypothetical protein